MTTTTSTREEMTIRLEEKTECDLKLKHFEDDGLKVGRCRMMSARVAMRLLSLPGRRRDLHCLASTYARWRGRGVEACAFMRLASSGSEHSGAGHWARDVSLTTGLVTSFRSQRCDGLRGP